MNIPLSVQSRKYTINIHADASMWHTNHLTMFYLATLGLPLAHGHNRKTAKKIKSHMAQPRLNQEIAIINQPISPFHNKYFTGSLLKVVLF